MNIMPLSIIIDAPVEEVYKVLDTPSLNPVWNPVIEKITENTPGQCTVESFMGNFKTNKTSTPAPDRSITFTTDSPLLKELKYVLVSLSANQTRVHGIVVFTGTQHYTALHRSVGKKLLNNLKRYVEHHVARLADAQFIKEL